MTLRQKIWLDQHLRHSSLSPTPHLHQASVKAIEACEQGKMDQIIGYSAENAPMTAYKFVRHLDLGGFLNHAYADVEPDWNAIQNRIHGRG